MRIATTMSTSTVEVHKVASGAIAALATNDTLLIEAHPTSRSEAPAGKPAAVKH